jgi:Putative porin
MKIGSPALLILACALLSVGQKVIAQEAATKEPAPASEAASQEAGVVRVPYISKNVRDQIRNEVQAGVEKNVLEAVMKKAETERWGVPNSWPSWLQKIKLSGDVRFRAELDKFAKENSSQYIDALAVNRAGGTIPAGQAAFLNTTEDTERLRLRARLGVNVAVASGWDLGLRLATGSTANPVSTNITLGSNLSNAAFNLDRAFLAYKSPSKELQVWAGRFASPWLSTDLVWDDDLNFGGLAASYAPFRAGLAQDDGAGIDPYVTIGAFPLEDIEQSPRDKWLYGAQTGFNFLWENQNTLKFAVAYYSYDHVNGEFNTFGSNLLDFTAPKFVQKGNTLFDIRNDDKTNTQLAALASDYKIVDVTLVYDLANFAPTHIVFIADFVRNVGFNAQENLLLLESSTNLDFDADMVQEHVDGHKFEVLVGWPKISKSRDWNVSMAYKKLESDAVLDAFTDSDFHLGGTDAEGYILKAQYGWADNVWSSFQLLSANEINGAPLGVDVWQIDMHVRF